MMVLGDGVCVFVADSVNVCTALQLGSPGGHDGVGDGHGRPVTGSTHGCAVIDHEADGVCVCDGCSDIEYETDGEIVNDGSYDFEYDTDGEIVLP